MRKIILPILLLLMACVSLVPQRLFQSSNSSVPPSVRTHPDGPLYVGDQVSFEVYHPAVTQPTSTRALISLAGKPLAEESFGSFGMGGRSQATFYWVWDTRELLPGDYTLTFSLQPGTEHWDEKITLLPAGDVPYPEPDARWESAETACCVIHYISGTDAEKDLEALKTMVAAQSADVEDRLKASFQGKIPITFLPRTLGHGGFTSDGIYVSYLHQNYAGSTARQVTHHEMVHWLDGQVGGMLRPSILQEGLAVYLSDGHFKLEPILPRAAALLDLGWYIPLRKLTNSFYLSQHEIGYAEAAALVSYMISTYGWEKYNNFYRNIEPVPAGSDAGVLDAALQARLGLSLDQLEQNFLNFLRKQPVSDPVRTDLRLTVAFYDAVRRYESDMDPSAYFLQAWLPDVARMRQRNIVADFLRHPDSPLNRQIELLFVSGDVSLLEEKYTAAEIKIRIIVALLDLQKYIY
ncbi:MAG: hypothetical protein NTW32_12870 [Chloroflexi bacterium]|nr:hypothetical protein [Chloroflexota bacterium]